MPWDATGNFTVGAAQWSPAGGGPSMTDFWVGDIDEVHAYQGVIVYPVGSSQFAGCTGSPVACPDYSGGNHPVTVSASGANVVNAALPSTQTGPVLNPDGAAGYTATSGSVVGTSQSFTVGAWAQLPTVPAAGPHVIVSNSGANKSFFELQYDGDSKALCFDMWGADSTSAPGAQACGPNATAGAWVFVARLYDQVAGKISLYTASPGGLPTLAGSAAFTSPWKATGALRIGAGYSGSVTAFLGGYVTDVQVYPGVIGDVSALM